MAGPRTNLAVTKDGGTYNKLQRPDNLFDELTASKANERKRERAYVALTADHRYEMLKLLRAL